MSILGKKKKEHRGQLRRFFTLCIMLFMLVSALAGCGKSEGARISLGYLEKDDVACAITYLEVHFGIKKFSLGFSLLT